jgi:hypothetical protein
MRLLGMRLVGSALLLIVASVLPRAQACSFCPGAMQRTTLAFELEQAAVVVYGTIANSRLNLQPDALPGTGSSELHVEQVLKNQPQAALAKTLTLPRYVPVLDAKNPPRYLVFFEVHKGKLEFALARTASPAVTAYLEGAAPERTKDRVQALRYYAQFLDHADPAIAEDAFLEFARSKDHDIGQAARTLSPAFVRRLLAQPKLEPERLSLFAFLLGGCGGEEDARYLRKLAAAGGDAARAVDGILAGYIHLRPKEGWQLTHDLLADPKQSFHVRVGAVRTLRFYHGWQPKETHAQVVHGLSLIVPDGDLADFAIEDLRQWKTWDLTANILAQFSKKSHEAPIIRRAIIRYALCCPLPEARAFIDRIRPSESEAIRDIEEGLAFER